MPKVEVLKPSSPHTNGVHPEPQEEEDDAPFFDEWPTERLSDMGNGRRMVRYFGDDMRYVTEWGWMIWDGKRWARDVDGAIMRLAEATVERMYEEAEQLSRDDRKMYRRHILRTEGMTRLKAMVEKATTAAGVVARPEAFDADAYLFNCDNGTINLRTGILQPHNRADMISKLAPVGYDPDATCAIWEMVLNTSFAGNTHLISFMQRAVGYSLSADTGAQAMFILWGTGQNGKSTILGAIQSMMGAYAQSARSETLMTKDRNDGGDSANASVARMVGVRLIRVGEAEENKPLAVSLVKDLTGDDIITARFRYKEDFDFRPTAKIWMPTNHRPIIKDTTLSIWRRLMLIPFTVTIPEEERDPNMVNILASEQSGILAWAVRGCMSWIQNGLCPPPEVLAAVAEYRTNMDRVQAFIDEYCVISPTAYTKQVDLYKQYSSWAESVGERPLSGRRFSEQMKEHGYQNGEYGAGGYSHWFGIGLRIVIE